MGQGGYVFCELDSVKKEFPDYQRAFAELETEVISKCNVDWSPKTCGYLTPNTGQYGRTSILPALFRGFGQVAATPVVAGTNCLIHWRQKLTSEEHQALIMGRDSGNVLPESFKVAWIGLAFPNKQMHITELRWQISDSKYIRVNIEELMSYNKPALIFENGYVLNEKEAFELYGYVEGPLPTYHDGFSGVYQRIVPLGAAYYEIIDRVLGAPGAVI